MKHGETKELTSESKRNGGTTIGDTVQYTAGHLERMEVVSVLVNVSDLSHYVAEASVKSNDASLNGADLALQLRHVERTLSALQRNLDDFYFVSLTAITFGKWKT